MASKKFGLYQKNGRGTWYMARDIPDDVRHRFGGKTALKISTGHTDRRLAENFAIPQWDVWGRQIEEARAFTSSDVIVSEAGARELIDSWRRGEVEKAAALSLPSLEVTPLRFVDSLPPGAAARVFVSGPFVVNWPPEQKDRPVKIDDAGEWARRYYVAHPGASRSPGLSFEVGRRLEDLKAAANGGSWVKIDGFDSSLDSIVCANGGVLTTATREALRPYFAMAWLEVEQHRELQRERAASFLAAIDATKADASALKLVAPEGYTPKAGDKTVAEVIASYKKDRDKRCGETDKRFGHIFEALEEIIGRDKPWRALEKSDFRKVKEFLSTVPANAGKKYPKKSLKEAAKLAKQDGAPLLTANTIRSYMQNLNAIANFAVGEGFASSNHCAGLVPPKNDSVKRRGFTQDELFKIFGGLEDERTKNSHWWWLVAILCFSGARANEICQLNVADVKSDGDLHFFELRLFDESGKRRSDARLKTKGSARCLPIHPELIDAGLLNFVKACRARGETKLFPGLKLADDGRSSNQLSRYFIRLKKRVGLDQPALTLHGFRHGFRDAARRAGIPTDVADALGGWTSKGIGASYGDATELALLADHLSKVDYWGFKLGPPPLEIAA